MHSWHLLFILLWVLATPAQADTRPTPASLPREDVRGYFRFPALTDDGIVFTAEGDLWRVPMRGGDATRLTSLAGEESHAAISPDGRSLAFSASFEGATEVYVMRLDVTQPPVRLTYESGAAIVAGWTPAGEILYTTRRHAELPDMHLARLDPETRQVSLLPLALASDGSFDAAGRTVFFTRFPFHGSFTKRYRGGGAQSIWRYTLGDDEAAPLTSGYRGTSRSPMAWKGRVHFASDRDGTMNLWSMDEHGGDLRQLTDHAGFDVQSPSLRNGRIAYQLGADLRVLDLTNGEDVLVPVRLTGLPERPRDRVIESPAEWVTSAHLSPTGDHLVLTARGQVFVAPVKKGPVVLAAGEPGVRYRDARFMPDGRTLFALSDRSGEFEVWTLPTDAGMSPRAMTSGATMTRRDVVASPDGRLIAHQDSDLRLWIHDVRTGEGHIVATSTKGTFRDVRWSADGQWLAYVAVGANGVSRIWLHGVADRQTRPVTTDRFDSHSPAWSPDGAWLYFLSERTFENAVASPWGPRQPEPFFDRQTRVYQLALRKGLRSRFATRAERDVPARDPLAALVASGEGQGSLPVPSIDFDGLEDRLTEVPLVPGNYSSLETDGKRLYFLSWEAAASPRRLLRVMPIDDRRMLDTLVSNVDRYELSLDRSALLVERGDNRYVLPADGSTPDELARTRVSLAEWTMTVRPHDEWRQIFVDAWRLQRDGFYDRGMHGVDWDAARRRYEPLVNRVTDRAELSDLIGQMVGELSALHMFVRGGDLTSGEPVAMASLGATLERDAGRGGYRITRIFRGDPDLPSERGPLSDAHADVREGDVITAIDGVSVLPAADIQLLLRDAVGREVRLRVVAGDTGVVRDVTVRPISMRREADLRYREWQVARRRHVEASSDGRIGYLHLRAMTADDMGEWQRAFYPVHTRPGLIIDLRRNTGGNIDSWLLSRLLRQAWFFWQPRVGDASPNMPYAYRGHVVVLVDQETASDGEAFAEGVRRLGLGIVIGTRTWGGEIWGSGGNALLDRGVAAVPDTGVFSADGEWLIEGHGVDPDIVVDNLPHATFTGRDAQLDAAVAYLRQRMHDAPVPSVVRPPYPDKAGGTR